MIQQKVKMKYKKQAKKIEGTVVRNSTLNATERKMLMKEEMPRLQSSIADFKVNISMG